MRGLKNFQGVLYEFQRVLELILFYALAYLYFTERVEHPLNHNRDIQCENIILQGVN